jgi:uncharacterized RDD family membrane protein YckC
MSGLDTLRSITTPEGVELNLRLAGPVPRACAWAIDLAIRSVIMIALFVGLTPLGGVGFGAFLIAVFLLEWFYPALCEVYLDGATPGKKSMGLRVVNDDGTPVQMAAAMIRNLLRAADFLPVLYGVGLVSMLVNREFKRLGDLVAQTVVIYRDESRADVSIPAAAPAPPATPLTVQEARAVLDCAERMPELTAERADELARLAAPLIGADQAEGGNARERLLGVANHLVGRARP